MILILLKKKMLKINSYLLEIKIRLCLAVSTDLLHVERILILVYPLSEQVMVKSGQNLHLKLNK